MTTIFVVKLLLLAALLVAPSAFVALRDALNILSVFSAFECCVPLMLFDGSLLIDF